MGIFSQLLPLVKPLSILIGPAPIFYLFRSWQSIPASARKGQRRSLPKSSLVSVTILSIVCLIYLCNALFGESENIYALTQARFKTSVTVIQSRLSRIRNLTTEDHILLERLATSLSERLNYAIYGPKPLIECSWCLSPYEQPNSPSILLGESMMYILYPLPQIISPYLFHAFILGLTTTPFLTSTQITRALRVYLSYALGLTLAAELWILATFDITSNSSANELREVTWLHWDLHFFRYIMLFLIAVVHAGLLYIVDAGLFPLPATKDDRILHLSNIAETVTARLKLTRAIRIVVLRNPVWRDRMERWWRKRNVEKVEIPEDVQRKWETEARVWVDGMIQIKEE